MIACLKYFNVSDNLCRSGYVGSQQVSRNRIQLAWFLSRLLTNFGDIMCCLDRKVVRREKII